MFDTAVLVINFKDEQSNWLFLVLRRDRAQSFISSLLTSSRNLPRLFSVGTRKHRDVLCVSVIEVTCK